MKQTNTCFSRFFVSFLKKKSEKIQGKNELTFSFWFQTVSAVILLLSTRHVTRRTRRLGDNNKRSRWRFVILFIYLQYFLFLTATFPRSCLFFLLFSCVPCLLSKCVYVCVSFLSVCDRSFLSFLRWFVTESRHGASHACHTRIDSSSRCTQRQNVQRRADTHCCKEAASGEYSRKGRFFYLEFCDNSNTQSTVDDLYFIMRALFLV